MTSPAINLLLATLACCLLPTAPVAHAQSREIIEPVPNQAADTIDVARLVRAKIPWTWLLKDPAAGASVVTADQKAQADTMRALTQVARSKGYDQDPRYTRLRRAMDDAALAEIARLSLEEAIPISDADRKCYLKDHPGRYDQYRLRHIYIALHGVRDGSTRSEGQALDLARAIGARLARGEDFEALARTYSDDAATAASGGELSVLLGAYMAPPFLAAVRGAADGMVTPPVKGDDGFHVIRVDQRIGGDAATAAYQIDRDIIADRLPELIRQATATVQPSGS